MRVAPGALPQLLREKKTHHGYFIIILSHGLKKLANQLPFDAREKKRVIKLILLERNSVFFSLSNVLNKKSIIKNDGVGGAR